MNVIVHGGAGATTTDPARRQRALDGAVRSATATDEPVEAVLAAVRALESDPVFNAGRGSAVQSDGRIRTDAGLMDCETAPEAATTGNGITAADGERNPRVELGAACSMEGVEHAIDVARVVARETPHVLVAGDRARALAGSFGVETDRDLWTAATRERWAALDPPESQNSLAHLPWVREQFGGSDTVGAVATDGETIVAGTSTGGRWCALAGRVGDVPQVGAGFHATPVAGASATGAGEAIARFGLARRATAHVADGLGPQAAADRAIEAFGAATGSHAGIIVIDRAGTVGSAFNAESMATADCR